jgi:Abnormal spindle-like microcephaly-assoc'd, ASPM-SPD-2-Hydin
MRRFSSRYGIISYSSPALALTHPTSDCSIKIRCFYFESNAMGLIVLPQFVRSKRSCFRYAARPLLFCGLACLIGQVSLRALGQVSSEAVASLKGRDATVGSSIPAHILRGRSFLAGRTLAGDLSASRAMGTARRQHAAMLVRPAVSPLVSSLGAAWQAVGPNQVASLAFGNVTGRITSIAIDPADTSGNTVYVGTTGGGVWKSTNAAGPASSVSFTALTDTLPVFSANAGTSAVPSLSIGAITVQAGVVLAGTGDPNDASDSYYGSGILRSADGGLTWTLIQDSLDGAAGNHSFSGLGFAGFAWSSTTPGTVVAAVSQAAEGAIVNAPDQTNSVMGLYYSTDAGVTWQMSTIMDGGQTVQTPLPSGADLGGRAATAVVWNAIRQRFYAAVRYHGYYESADGVTWTRLANQPGTGLTLSACPTAPGTTGSASCPIFRGALAVQANTGDTFALTVDSANNDQGLWQDLCSFNGSNCNEVTVTFGKRLSSVPMEVGNGSTVIAQADYNLALAAVPSGPSGSAQDTLVYAGTIDLYRCSLAAGCVLRNTTNSADGCAAPAQVAPAQHAIATLATQSDPLLYLGNDGGLWRSTDGVNQQSTPCSPDDATHFQNLNSSLGSLAEVVSFAQDPASAGTLLVGMGANGTAGTATASSMSPSWPQLSAGEGGTVAIDQNNPFLWYVSTGAGVNIRQCSSGAACTSADFAGTPTVGPTQVDGDDSLIDAPWILDPGLSSDVVLGTCRVWRGSAASGALWSPSNAISTDFSEPQSSSCASASPVVRSLAAGGPISTAAPTQNAGSTVLYAGMAGSLDGGGGFGGHLFSTTSAGTASNATAWTDLSTSPVVGGLVFNPGDFDVSSLAADSHDATGRTIYATVMGFAGNGINAAHVYRSVDGGAQWSNISSNLPNAPANSVVVDPNDANTLYVAMDTGVYVTTQVTTCVSANCWSIYGAGLPNAPVVELAAATAVPTGDGRTGELRAATYGRGLWQIPLLTASTPIQPAISLSPGALTFGPQAVSTASAAQTITVTNTGSAPLTVSQIATTGDFNEIDNCTAASVAVGLTCTIQIQFLPTVTGARSGILTVYGNVPGGQSTASLSGTGSPASAIVLTPITLVFPATTINATSAVQNITISNTSGNSLALQSPSITGTDFKLTANTCGASLASNEGCTVSIAFTPTASGTRTGSFSITDGAGTQTASLRGVGASPATDSLSPTSLTFGAQALTTASTAQQITLTNAGDLALTLIAAQITSGDFSVVNSCGNSLNPHSTCSMSVTFEPRNVGALTGTLTVSDQYRTQTISLSGLGVAPPGVSLSPLSPLVFTATGVGVTSAVQTVTLTNNEPSSLVVQSVVVKGDFAIVPNSNNCGSNLVAYTACTMQIVFVPTVGGPRTGTLTVADGAVSSPQTLSLTGDGVDFTLSSDGGTSVTIANGQNAVYPLLLTSAGNVTGTVTFSCAGMPANSTCNITPSSVTLGNTTVVSVTVLTGVSSTGLSAPPLTRRHREVWLAALLPLCLVGLRRKRLSRIGCAVLICMLIAATGCGAGRAIPLENGSSPSSPSGPVTASGTYTVVVSAASAGLVRTIDLTLIVQ